MYKVGITGQPGFLGTHLYNTLGLYPEKYTRIPFEDAFFEDISKLTEFVSEKVALATEKVEGLSKEEMIQQALEKAIPNILTRQASAIEKNLVNAPWTGRILDVSKGVLKINAGKDVVHHCPHCHRVVGKRGTEKPF